MTNDHWRPAAAEPEHALAALDGVAIGEGVTLAIELGPRSAVGSTYFRARVARGDGTVSLQPLVFGLHNRGPYPGFNWVEVLDYRPPAAFADGATLAIDASMEHALFVALASLVPPGGHLMAEYDSPARADTARALVAGVPPLATPLGWLLYEVGCGVAFRDWYISEGGREGPRKLQGFRALDAAHAARRAVETLPAIEAFLADPGRFPPAVVDRCLPLARAAKSALHDAAAHARQP